MSSVVENAIVQSTNLGYHDGWNSIPTFMVTVGGDGWGQGFGGTKLGGEYTDKVVYGILGALEVESWERLKGTHVRVMRDTPGFTGRIIAIGHYCKDKWFHLPGVSR